MSHLANLIELDLFSFVRISLSYFEYLTDHAGLLDNQDVLEGKYVWVNWNDFWQSPSRSHLVWIGGT